MTLTCNVRFSTHKEFTPGPGQYDVSAVSTVKKGSIVNSSRYYTTDGNILTVWGVRLLKMFGWMFHKCSTGRLANTAAAAQGRIRRSLERYK